MQQLIPPDTDFNLLPEVLTADPGRELAERFRLDYSQPLPPPPVAIELAGDIVGTLGNFSVLIGKAKSKKTFLNTLAMAATIRGGKVSDLFTGTLPPDKNRVIFCDTEQGEYSVNKTARRVMGLLNANTPPENFDVYHLRGADTRTRHEIISYLIDNTPDLGLLIIDGIRDLVTSINDEEQATAITNDLLRWTEQRHIHIITVLHQNKGDTNARGHLGTELINKAENTISVTREPDKDEISRVECEYSRHKEFEPFAFTINENGLPERVNGWKPKAADRVKNQKIKPGDLSEYQHHQIINLIKQQGNEFSYSELQDQIIYAVNKIVEPIGQSTARAYITFYKNNGHVKYEGKTGTVQAKYIPDPLSFGTTLPR